MRQDETHPTGVAETADKIQPDTVRARERKAFAALELRAEGQTWDEVAELIGYPSADAAKVAAERMLEREFKEDSQSLPIMRAYAGRRLDKMLRSVIGKAQDPEHPEHLPAVDRVVKIVDQWTRLFGVNAPAEVVVHNPTAQAIEDFVSKVQNANAPELEQGSIFDEDAPGIDVIDAELVED